MTLDRYYTPPHVADAMARVLCPRANARYLDPCCGERALGDAARRVWDYWSPGNLPQVIEQDIEATGADFFAPVQCGRFDAVIMNPPYAGGLDLRFVLRAFEFAPRIVALLRSAALHNKSFVERVWKPHTLKTLVHCGRLRFSGPDAVIKRGNNAGRPTTSYKDFVIVEILAGKQAALPYVGWLGQGT